MTKEKLFKDYESCFGSIIAADGIYKIKNEVVKTDFEEFYNKLSKIIKVSNITSCGMIKEEQEEDSSSIGINVALYLYTNEGMTFSSKIRFFIVKTNNYVEWILTGDGKFCYLPSSL